MPRKISPPKIGSATGRPTPRTRTSRLSTSFIWRDKPTATRRSRPNCSRFSIARRRNLLAQLAVDGAARAGRADIAHKLRGSALAVGAGRVASAAETLEALLNSDRMSPPERERALGGLAAAVAEARGAIAGLLG